MIDSHLKLLRARGPVSESDERDIRQLVSATRTIRRRQALVHAYERVSSSAILVSGIAARVKHTSDGRRQVTELHVPGDFVDLHSLVLKYLDHDVTALTDCEFAMVPHRNLEDLTSRSPDIARLYWFTTLVDAAISREWELSFSKRTAAERMAHLFCELHTRLRTVGLAGVDEFNFPLTQSELGECLGLSIVHVNRTLMILRSEGLIELENWKLKIRNLANLRERGMFEPGYLYLEEKIGGTFHYRPSI